MIDMTLRPRSLGGLTKRRSSASAGKRSITRSKRRSKASAP